MKRETIHILLVDASEAYSKRLRTLLEASPRRVEILATPNLAEAHRCLSWTAPDIIIAEWLLPDGKGLDLLTVRTAPLPCPLIIVSEQGAERDAVTALKAGAWDYIVKSDVSLAGMADSVERVLAEWDRAVDYRQFGHPIRKADSDVASEEKFRTFFESAAAGMVTVSPATNFLQVNQAFCDFIGYGREELSQLQVADVTHPADLAKTAENYLLMGSGQEHAIDYQKRFVRKSGDIVWGHVSVASVLDEDGLPRYYVGLVQDITESKLANKQISDSQRMLQLVLDYIPQHVFWKNRDSVYLGCNRNFARAAGLEPQTLTGKTDLELPWTEAEAEFYRECDRRVMAADRPELHIIETQLQADGKQAWLDTNKIPLHDSDGQVVGILGTFEDITERKQAEDKLVETNRELDAFVYTVSHDLRTPLTPIISYAEVLQETCKDKLDEQSLDCLAKIESQGRRMLAVMEDLLVLARVGHVSPPDDPIEASRVLDEVLISLGSRIAEAGVVIEKLPLPQLLVPETLLTQIFENLISNAIRYAGREGNPICIGGERCASLVRFYVRDHGPGIATEERSQIFELFYRGDASRKVNGTGVGLATVKKIARLFNGTAWVEETPGGGSTFWVELTDI